MGLGFVFSPTDKDLLKSFLKPKVNGESLNCELIVEKVIYGPLANPWDVLDDASTPWIVSGDSNYKVAYVFTHLEPQAGLVPSSSSLINNNNKSSSGGVWRRRNQFLRRAGCGTWNGKTGPLPIRDHDNNLLGIKREFVFQINHVAGDVDFNAIGRYKLHEYVLTGCQHYALCKITLDTSKIVNLYCQDVSNITRSMQNLNCTHVLGKRQPFEAQDLCSGPSKMICM